MEIEISFVFFVSFVINLREQLLFMGGEERMKSKRFRPVWGAGAGCIFLSKMPQLLNTTQAGAVTEGRASHNNNLVRILPQKAFRIKQRSANNHLPQSHLPHFMSKNTTKSTAPAPLRITDTSLRDAHQSLWATRMRTSDIMDIIDVVDSVGFYSLECWGGATFDVCLRFLRENPWERLRLIKSKAKKTPLQMLLRGQNILGYKNYPDDVLERFVALSVKNGVDIFRIFDALNDNRNIAKAIAAVKKFGGHAQGTICYTISPVHTIAKGFPPCL